MSYRTGQSRRFTVGEQLGQQGHGAYARLLLSDPCAYCGAPSTALDHITPESMGGQTRWDNVAGVCKSCNSSKATRSLIGFLGARAAGLRERQQALQVQIKALAEEAKGWAHLGRTQ